VPTSSRWWSILCEVLTGQPAFLGRTSGEIQRRAALGDTADALRRLDACGADADLIALTLGCLAREPEDRPGDAGVLAGRITGYLAGVQDRLRNAERQRAVAEAQAVEDAEAAVGSSSGLAAALLALTTMGALGASYYQKQRSDRASTLAKVIGDGVDRSATWPARTRKTSPDGGRRWPP